MNIDKETLYCIFAGYDKMYTEEMEESEDTPISFEEFMFSKGFTHFESDVCEFLKHEMLIDLHDNTIDDFQDESLATFDGNILEVPIKAYDQTITKKYESWLTLFICEKFFGLPITGVSGHMIYVPEIYYSDTDKESLFIAKKLPKMTEQSIKEALEN